jgi:gliding motility-associated-like protein
VLLEDPDHEPFEQPRFELNIRDEQGNLLPCGEYKVRAAASIPGFESCDDTWRVRPWTTAGFELQSFLGTTIQIEILTTDCSRGAHAGYAYIDASCRPLELILDGYCEESPTATYLVTPGFDAYHWNTGETTSSITIQNPVAGTVYEVTVTSSTGCTLVLKDTLPTIFEVPIPDFNELRDTVLCKGESLWIKPGGDHIAYVNSVELDYQADSFFVKPDQTTIYHFYTKDIYGCMSDTVSMKVEVVDLNFDLIVDKPCGNIGVGTIEMIPTSGIPPFTFYVNGINQGNTSVFPDIPLGAYELRLVDSIGCEVKENYTLNGHPVPHFNSLDIVPTTCGKPNGSIEVFPTGSSTPLMYALNQGTFQSFNKFLSLDSGTYVVHVMNAFGCRDSAEATIAWFEAPGFVSVVSDSTTCGANNGSIIATAQGGLGDLRYSLNNLSYQSNTMFSGLSAGNYTVYVKDEGGCIEKTQIEVYAIGYPRIISIESRPASCDLENGSVVVLSEGGRAPVYYALNTLQQNTDGMFSGMPADIYDVVVSDALGCMAKGSFTISAIPRPYIHDVVFETQECDREMVAVAIDMRDGLEPYVFSRDGGLSWSPDSIVRGLFPGEYLLVGADATGCTADTALTILTLNDIYIPNVFSPNDDGVNDLFNPHMRAGDGALITSYQIFSRWGDLLYELDHKYFSTDTPWWDGKYQGDYVASGVYTYHMMISLDDGRIVCRTGDVTVLR